jgi:hypothetical protein
MLIPQPFSHLKPPTPFSETSYTLMPEDDNDNV